MIADNWQEFWWKNITGARSVVDKVAQALLESKTVVLSVPSDLPWRYDMRSAVQSAFVDRSVSSDIIVSFIDISDDNPTGLEPGRFILEHFASPSVKAGYRERSRVSIQEYIASNNVINNRIIWIKGLNKKDTELWLGFCKGFAPKSAADGLFVLETPGGTAVSDSKALADISFDDCVSNYDVQLFNSFILSDRDDLSDEWKSYIAAATAVVCGVDAEVSEQILQTTDFRTHSPVDGVCRVAEMESFARRGAAKEHILCLCRNGELEKLAHRLWAAQVQVLFPRIELERAALVAKWSPAIRSALENNRIYQYGERLSEPIDVELGTLCYMMGCRSDEDDKYILYIPDDADRARIRFLHECRNSLAHADCCSPEQVAQLIEG